MIDKIKTIAIILAVGAAVYFFKDYQHQKEENKRQSENAEQLINWQAQKIANDSARYAKITLTKKELDNYIESNRADLSDFLREQRIHNRNIKEIITQQLSYADTVNRAVDLSPVLDAIKNQRDIKIPIKDSTACMIIEGFVVFEKDTLRLDINNRKFKNKSDVISHYERNQWSFLGLFKTRLFGRKEITVTVRNSCGDVETFQIAMKKK